MDALQSNSLEKKEGKRAFRFVNVHMVVCVCIPTSLMLSSGLRRVNMVCRCCCMSPGIKKHKKSVRSPSLIELKSTYSFYLHVCCAAARSERLKKRRSHFPEVRKEQLL